VTVRPHTAVTWTNHDAVDHTITTTPDKTAYLNPAPLSLSVPAGGSVSYTFTKPGLYQYFDTTMATWNGDIHRVKANDGAPSYLLAMEGIVWVQGPIADLSSSVTNPIPGKDEFASDFLAIKQGGTVAWYNADTDKHVIALVPGWGGQINPTALSSGVIEGTDDAPPNGETKMMTFGTPGLYYFYCSAHASIQATWRRAVAHPDASEQPIPMEAFVLVV
jgi:plastocyanin